MNRAYAKRKEPLNWDDLRFFTALAQSHRISAAAIRLGVSHGTVSGSIDRLESALQQYYVISEQRVAF